MSTATDLTSRARQAIQAQPANVQAQYASRLTGDLSRPIALAIIRKLVTTQVDNHERGIVPPERHGGGDTNGRRPADPASDKQVWFARKLITTKLPQDAQAAELAKLEGTPSKVSVSAIIDKLISKADLVVTADNQASEAQIRFINSLRAERGFEALTADVRISKKEASEAINDLKLTPKPAAPTAKTTELGIYRYDGEIHRVKRSRTTGYHYAQRLTIVRNDEGKNTGEWVPAKGMIYKLKPEHRLSLEEAKAWGKVTEVCCRCGAELENDGSIEAGIGPVCATKGW